MSNVADWPRAVVQAKEVLPRRSPERRADLLVDFSDLEPGSQLTLANTAGAPFDGHPFPATGAAEAADPGQLLPYPDVMRFRAVAGHPARRPRPGRLATDLTAPTQADLSGAVRRAVALAEQELDGRPNMVTLRDLAVAADGDPQAPVITVVGQHGQTLARLRTAAVSADNAVGPPPGLTYGTGSDVQRAAK